VYKFSRDSKIEVALSQWGTLTSQGFELVHTFSHANFIKSELSKKSAEEVFKQWDVISTSLISLNSIVFQRQRSNHAIDQNTGPLKTHAFYDLMLVLDVPPQNILGTHDKDVWFPNHVGSDRKQGNSDFLRKGYQLADRIFSGIDKRGRCMAPKGYNVIKKPQEIWNKTGNRHNEILVIGKEGVSMHFTPTKIIKIKEIIYAPKKYFSGGDHDVYKFNNEYCVRMLKNLNPNVPFREI
jgi:hypothetical protein